MSMLLDGLREDHANFGKILNVIESQAEAIQEGRTPDLDILVKAVTYFSGYPALFHHPAENAVCERLKKARPAVSASVDLVLAEHADVGARLGAFRRKVEDALAGRQPPDAEFAEAALAFVDAEWSHMEKERAHLFPAALAVLSDNDWHTLAGRSTLDRDLFFRGTVPEELRRLHDLMIECRTFDDRRIQRRALDAANSSR